MPGGATDSASGPVLLEQRQILAILDATRRAGSDRPEDPAGLAPLWRVRLAGCLARQLREPAAERHQRGQPAIVTEPCLELENLTQHAPLGIVDVPFPLDRLLDVCLTGHLAQ